MIELLKKIFFSTRLTAVLFIVFATSMAFGTFVESWYSTATARIWIYNATWFEAIMVFFVINFIGNISRYKLLRKEKWAVLMLHLSWVLIILGAFVTRYISFEGMMPIREGNTENVFYSDKTYLTVYVDGEINKEPKRKILEDDILVTSEAIKSNLPWNSDFNGQPFTISYVGFIDGAKEGLIEDGSGKEYLKIVEAGDGQRHDHYLESGEVTSIHNVLFSLNKMTEGAINIIESDGDFQIKSSFEGQFLRMADQFQGTLVKDSLQTFQLRSLYTTAGMQFVIPEPIIKGSYGIITIPENEKTENDQDALVVDITSNGETVRKKLLGAKGISSFSGEFNVGGLDFNLSYGSKVYTLPFGIKLNDFIAEKHPGTENSYASFMSKVSIDDDRPFDYDIYMNHILDHKGYRFFQASFHPDEKGTVLSVNHDFWGTWITYIGYFLLYAGLMGIMFFGKTRFKDLGASLEKLKNKRTKLAVLFILGTSLNMMAQENVEADSHAHDNTPTAQQVDSLLHAITPSKEHASEFGKLVIQDAGGRMKPINTFSSELLRKLSLKEKYTDFNSDQVFLSMMLNPRVWYYAEFIALDKKGQNDSIRKIIGLEHGKEFAKATDFFDEKGKYKLADYLQEAYATNTPNQFQKDFRSLDERLVLLNRALGGEIVKIFPLLNDENNKWISAVEYRGGQFQVSDSLYANFIKNAVPFYLMSLEKAVKNGDYSEADKLLAAFKKNQENHGSEVLPTENKIKAEVFYNRADIYNKLYKYYALVGLLMFVLLVFQIIKDRKALRFSIAGIKAIIYVFFILHTLGLIMRWYISGHAPWSDAYESILYVSWATLGMGLLFSKKSDMTVAAATFVTAMLLWIAHQSWVDPSIANLVPVLDSYWLMIHVAVIVGSYGPLTVGMILGVVSLLLIIMTNDKNKVKMEHNIKELTIINELSLTVGLVMLTIGNFLGGQWANESWGRYWGWDPKETWALISIMIYAFVIHTRLIPGLRGKWLFNLLSVIAFGSIMMTYFGVNFYLVGLHSYASGAQVITPTFIYYTIFGVVVLGGVSYWRNKKFYAK
ncbi:cytochrome C biogenesis protein [Arenibacter sp. TNZ]|jgi:cytochrome c-type biogenesis protein CcsB|uniref:cytochrome c biogenesis protein CcsA n=1 Tax=Arenibacter TaxID=178469 RepID=UPI000CD3E6CC|nr:MULTISPECIES: cytochrome c biogenesis protein CcsA [Arenibacter]MCM4172107.1 cytochrome C biogenesis protein [Arenibacter sp. TNZ]